MTSRKLPTDTSSHDVPTLAAMMYRMYVAINKQGAASIHPSYRLPAR